MMMTALMKTWTNEVKQAGKELVKSIAKDTVLLCVIKVVEEYLVKRPMKKIIEICNRNEWNPDDYIPSF